MQSRYPQPYRFTIPMKATMFVDGMFVGVLTSCSHCSDGIYTHTSVRWWKTHLLGGGLLYAVCWACCFGHSHAHTYSHQHRLLKLSQYTHIAHTAYSHMTAHTHKACTKNTTQHTRYKQQTHTYGINIQHTLTEHPHTNGIWKAHKQTIYRYMG